MQFNPRPYQHEIIQHILSTPRCAVYAGMGLGKTVSTLTALDAIIFTDDRPALIIAPLRVAQSTWPAEVQKWDHLKHLRVVPVVGDARKREKALQGPADIFTINFENVPWLLAASGPELNVCAIVVDESTKLKGYRSRQGATRARELAKVAFEIPHFIELTGTPSPNGLIDLWGQAWFLDQGERLGKSFKAFTDRWFYNTSRDPMYQKLEPQSFAEEQITARLKDLTVTIDARDHFDLEEPIRNVITVQLPPSARDIYDEMEDEMFVELSKDTIVDAVSAGAKTVKCLQIANGALYLPETDHDWERLHDAKLDALRSVVEEAAGASVLVAYQFQSDATRLQKAFPQARRLDKNPKTIDEWNAGKIPILLAHPASAGHGINLQDGGNILVFFGLWWNLEEHQQIIERIGPVRQMQAGHDRPVFIHYIVADDTIDEDVMKRLEGKASVQQLLLERMKRRGVSQ